MSKNRKHQQQHIRIRGVRRDPPDIRKLGQAIIALAQAQAEKEAEAQYKDAQATAAGGESSIGRPPRARDA